MNDQSQPEPLTRGWLVTRSGETQLMDGLYMLGRHPNAEIRVDDLSVSRRHVQITVSADVVRIEDLGSRNGTWVNNARLNGPRNLQDGDEVRIGAMCWLFRRSLSDVPTQAIFTPRGRREETDEEVI